MIVAVLNLPFRLSMWQSSAHTGRTGGHNPMSHDLEYMLSEHGVLGS